MVQSASVASEPEIRPFRASQRSRRFWPRPANRGFLPISPGKPSEGTSAAIPLAILQRVTYVGAMKASNEPDSPLATPALLTDLADYHAGSIVSRTLLKSPGGSLTLFAFAEGESLSEHTTPHDAIVLIVDGLARITVGGRVHEVASGGSLLMPANVPHAVHAAAPFKMLLVMLRSGD